VPTSLADATSSRETVSVAASNSFLVAQGGSGLLPLLLMVLWIVVACLVGIDASRRGDSTVAWGLLALILGPVGWLLYLALRRPSASD
jgi:hypothetical protein